MMNRMKEMKKKGKQSTYPNQYFFFVSQQKNKDEFQLFGSNFSLSEKLSNELGNKNLSV